VFLPKVGLVREIDERQSLGFTVQKGFRAGGAGVQNASGEQFVYDPEFTWNYELSYKGTLLDNRLSLNANVFFTDWTDQQVEVLEDPSDFNSSVIRNAANSSSKGFEVEANYRVNPALTGFASIGYVDSKFDDFVDQNLGDLSGFPYPEAPKWNLAVGGQYQSRLGWFVGADAKYLSEYLARFGADPQEYLDGYTVVNAQVGYRKDRWEVKLFAENLFDKEYFVYNDRDTTGDVAATLGPRQVIGVSATAEF
jgi:outer membrane receptor protein involved in Fe transport